jgi:hypothetical protein
MVYKCLNGIVLCEEDARCYLIDHFTISDPSLKLKTLDLLVPSLLSK